MYRTNINNFRRMNRHKANYSIFYMVAKKYLCHNSFCFTEKYNDMVWQYLGCLHHKKNIKETHIFKKDKYNHKTNKTNRRW